MSFVLKRGISAISTLTSQQTFKALCSHLRRPPRRPLRRPPQIMSTAGKPPISGYDTLAQRFSSYSKPLSFTDIQGFDHDGNVGPTEREMELEISWIFGIEYLARATEDDAERKVDELYGYLDTWRRRLIVPCVISNGKMACWVYCIVIPGAHGNYLSKKVCDTLGLSRFGDTDVCTIAGYSHQVQYSRMKYFADVNILGSDFYRSFNFMVFGTRWDE